MMALAAMLIVGEQAMSLEEPEYTVLLEVGDIEYRQYEPYLVSETLVENTADFKDAGNEGFRRLFDYISGDNLVKEKIAMTAPVTRAPTSEKISMTAPVQQGEAFEGWRVSFMLPTEYTMETAPVPTDDRVQITEVSGRLMAVLRYSGRWTAKNFLENKERLRDAVDRESVGRAGEFESAAYNPPFMPPFMRRNEVMVEVSRLPKAP
jgi:hypothetical protein